MKWWPVPYEEIEIPSRSGMTHVVTSGAKDAPPLVLLHGQLATLTVWAPNVADFGKLYRVIAINVMGQPSKSIPDPDEPIRDAADYAWLSETLDALNLDGIAYVTSELIGMDNQAPGELGNYELMICHRTPDD